MVVISKSEKETRKISENLAFKVINSKDPIVIALEGELGAGKTTFVRGFVRAFGIKAKIKSPTFVLMKKYEVHKNTRHETQDAKHLYHLDCYRVRNYRDLVTLDLKMIFNESHNIILIEWPERVSKILPKKLIRVHIDHVDKNKRKITINFATK